MKKMGLFGSVLLIGFSLSAFAGHVPVPNPSPRPTPSHGDSNLPTMNYWGGPVVQHAKIYAIFWGPGVNVDIQTHIGGFLRSLVDSTYFDTMNSQYNTLFLDVNSHLGTFQDIHRGRYMGETTIFPSNKNAVLDDSAGHYEVTQEIQHQIDIGVLPPNDADTDYIIFLPPNVNVNLEFGSGCIDWCAYHGATPQAHNTYMNYAVIPDITTAGQPNCHQCAYYGKNNDVFAATTYLVSNQIACGVTDPQVDPAGTNGGQFPESWIANDGETEITVMCMYNDTTNASAPRSTLKGKFGTYEVAPFWSQSKQACTTKTFTK
jgi:hypothetical protein